VMIERLLAKRGTIPAPKYVCVYDALMRSSTEKHREMICVAS